MPSLENLWQELEGTPLDGKIRLGQMHAAQPFPTFTGTLEQDGSEVPVMVRFWPDDAETGSVYDRHREAMFLQHPNLLQCLSAGKVSLPDGSPAVYGAYEQPQAFLSSLLEDRVLTASEAATLCEDVIAGLRYLHQNGLVYCNLDRSTIAHAGDRWALCDYSQLRPEGTGYASETRRLMGSISGAPPEAFNGVVTPAWDAWSVAHLIRGVFQDPRTARELRSSNGSGLVTRSSAAVPEPFAALASECLVPDPGARCSLEDIEQRVKAARRDGDARISEPEPSPAVPPQSVPVQNREINLAPNSGASESAPVYQPRRRYEEEHETAQGPLAQIPWRALLAGAVTVLLIALLINYLRGSNGPSPQVSAQQTAAPESDTRPTPVDPSPAAEADSTRSRTPDTSGAAATQRTSAAQVEQVVRQWAEAFRRKDLNAEMRYYAPRLRRFFQSSNVPSSFVQRTKTSALKEAGDVRLYDIGNLNTRFDAPDAATVTFDKAWDFVGSVHHTGKVRGELKLEKHGNTWQIVSERDLKVYRQSRTRT